MTTVARPRGPLPARVYWTRRLVLLSVVVLVGWLMIRWIDGGSSGATPPNDEQPAAATESDDPARTPVRDREPDDRERTARVRTVAESFERPREDCDLTKVRAVPSVADPVYSGEPVQLTLRISSTSSNACSLTIDPEHLLVSITSGRDVVWDSTKCDDAVPARELALQPRWSSLVEVTWSGRHSGRNCAPDASKAEPGTYTIEAAVLEGEPGEAEFEVVERPEPPDDDKGKGDDGDDKGQGDDKGDDEAGGQNGDSDNADDENADDENADDENADSQNADDAADSQGSDDTADGQNSDDKGRDDTNRR